MPTDSPLVHFNDGEGLDETDLVRLQSLIWNMLLKGSVNIGNLGNIHAMGHTAGPGGDPGHYDPRALGMLSDAIYIPSPYGFVASTLEVTAGGLLFLGYGPQQFLQRHGANTPGTVPTGMGNGHILSYTCDDDEIGIAGVAAPTVNPRYDSLGIRLGYATGNPTARDFEDAATRALTTTNPNKDQLFLLESEVVSGAEAASPSFPAHTAGYSRFLTFRRAVGETSLGTATGDVQLHAYPTRLGVETIDARNASYDPANWGTGISAVGLEKTSGVGAGLYFLSRQMHAGCRLVGVEISGDFSTDVIDANIARINGVSGGPATVTNLQDVGNGNPLGLTAGTSFVGLDDFDFPYWGNGRTYGPLRSNANANPAEGYSGEALGITLGVSSAIPSGDRCHWVRLYYLY